MKKLLLLYVVALFTVYSCKKENEHKNGPNENQVSVQYFEETDVTEADVIDFFDDFDKDTTNSDSAANFVDMEIQEAMYLLESAENGWLCEHSAVSYESSHHEFTIDVDIYGTGEDSIESTDLIAAYSKIYKMCVDTAISVEFDSSSLDKFIAVVDLSLGGSGSGRQDINVTLIVANKISQQDNCEFDEGWMAVNNAGGCMGNTTIRSDARMQLQRGLNSPCNQDFSCTPNVNYILSWVNINIQGQYDNLTHPSYGFWSHEGGNECMSSNEITNDFDAAIQCADDFRPESCPTCHVTTMKDVYRYFIVWDLIGPTYFHRYEFSYGDCILLPIPAGSYLPNVTI